MICKLSNRINSNIIKILNSYMSSTTKHPTHLRGKEIGLWYQKQSSHLRKTSLNFVSEFKIDQKNTEKISQLVKDVQKLGDSPLDTKSQEIQRSCSSDNLNKTCPSKTDLNDTDTDLTMLEDKLEDIYPYTDEMNINKKKCDNLRLKKDENVDQMLFNMLTNQMQTTEYLLNDVKRKQLPSYASKQDILTTIANNQVVVISGETGCGKTTQIPQYILENSVLKGNGSCTRIVVTQPRRISAISVAERIAFERGQRLGEDVGYQIRLEARLPQNISGSLLLCTTGIVLQWFHSDALLQNVSHILVDEVHEREVLGDFLISMLKRIANKRPDLRIILMSATLNAEQFSTYFGGCPVISIPGRLYPVEALFLEDVLRLTKFDMPQKELDYFSRNTKRANDKKMSSIATPTITPSLRENFRHWLRTTQKNLSLGSRQILEAMNIQGCPPTDLVATTIDYVIQTSKTGAILAFVPGLADIVDTIKALRRINPQFYDETSNRVKIYPLHSRLSSARQKGIFDKPPFGQRKIIISTNIAETSITVEDVVFVVDCGQIKVTTYDPETNTSTLAPVLVSKANAAQRRGRAGRVQAGKCYHLFSSFTNDRVLLETLPPEITRIRLEDTILRIKVLNLGSVTQFLENCLDPPASEAIDQTLTFLRDIQALELTDKSDKSFQDSSLPTVQTSRMTKKQRKNFFNSAIKNDFTEPDFDSDRLTPLGYHLANLPLDPQCAKLLILGALFCCLEPVLAVAACLSFKDPFEIPFEKQVLADKRRFELAGDSLSDHWTYHVVLSEYRALKSRTEKAEYCWRNFLNQRTMEDLCRLMEEFSELLYERSYIKSKKFTDINNNRYSHELKIFRAVIAGSLYPNFMMASAKMSNKMNETSRPFLDGRKCEGTISIHPKSINANISPIDRVWLAYFTRMKLDHGAKSTIFETTLINTRPFLFFSSKSTELNMGQDQYLLVDGWVKFKCSSRLAELIKGLKVCMDKLLECKVKHPGATDWNNQTTEGRILQTIVDFFLTEPPPMLVSKTPNFTKNKSVQDKNYRGRDRRC